MADNWKPHEDPELISLVRDVLAHMLPHERIELIDKCLEGYCHHCGSDRLPCYCRMDD
jgi:hypothetical protein